MRLTILHHSDIDDAKRKIERAVDELANVKVPGMLEMSRVEKRWNGTTLEFSLYAAMGPLGSQIRGMAIVAEKEVTFDIDLPKLLTSVVPEQLFETAVRGFLT